MVLAVDLWPKRSMDANGNVEARKLEHHDPHAFSFEVKYRELRH